jgi:hypothetical protein
MVEESLLSQFMIVFETEKYRNEKYIFKKIQSVKTKIVFLSFLFVKYYLNRKAVK